MNAATKRFLDQAVSGALLLFLTPLFLYWRFKAWFRDSPMLEFQTVVGAYGRPFRLAGLRDGITASPVLARLPALWNVFCQDLSLVGPRPIRAEDLPTHEKWRANLFALRSGLTGLWRLRDKDLGVEERVALDVYYVRNCAFTLDLQILYQTGRELFRRSMGRRSLLARWSVSNGVKAVVLEGASQMPDAADWEHVMDDIPAEATGEGRR